MRADTSGILRGALQGSAALGAGLASLGESLAGGIAANKERKALRQSTAKTIKGLMQFHDDNPDIKARLAPMLETLESDEVGGREKDAVIASLNPVLQAAKDQQARQFAQAETNFNRTMQAADVFLKGEALQLERDKINPTKATPFNELGYRVGADGTIQYQSTGFEEADKKGVADLIARKDALSTVDTDIAALQKFREDVANSTTGQNVLGYITSLFGDAAATKYAENFTSFAQDFAQRLAKARNGARVTDADVENAKKAIFNLAKSKTTNVQLVDKFITELTDRKAEIERADAYLAKNKVMIGYTGWQKGDTLPGSQSATNEQSSLEGQGTQRESDAQALARLGGVAQATEAPAPEMTQQEVLENAPVALPVPPGQAQAVIEPGRVRQPRVVEPVAPPEEKETDSDIIEGPGGVMYKRVDPAFGPSFMQKVPQADIQVDEAVEAVPVPAEPLPEEIDTTGAGVAEPTTQAPVQGAGSAARAVALQNNVQGPALPKYSAKLAESLVYDESATLRQPVAFAPGPAERKKLRAAGNVLLNLDANHSGFKTGTKTPKRRVLEPMMIVPDDAKPETQTAAALAIGLMDNLYEQVHGKAPSKSVEERLLTKSQNAGRGREGVVHSELFAVTDNKMVNFLKTEAGMKEYAAIIREAFQDVPKLKIFLPHSQKDQGAQTDKGSSEVSLALRTLKYL
tara:strand:+ start:872 stop:2941 length:2070 start_codon:yes stop_codon:yes gene_type:complete